MSYFSVDSFKCFQKIKSVTKRTMNKKRVRWIVGLVYSLDSWLPVETVEEATTKRMNLGSRYI